MACAIAHAELLLGNREQAALWEERFHTLHEPGFLAEFTYLDERRHAVRATLCLFRVTEALSRAKRTSIAPTGTISIITGTSSSIEPLFALSYWRVGILGDQTLVEWNPLLLTLGERLGFLTPEVLEHVANRGTLSNAPVMPNHVRNLFATALEIAPWQHLLMQAAFQTGVDNAVSKTVNLPTETSPDAVAGICRQAYHLGLKGITICRYGNSVVVRERR